MCLCVWEAHRINENRDENHCRKISAEWNNLQKVIENEISVWNKIFLYFILQFVFYVNENGDGDEIKKLKNICTSSDLLRNLASCMPYHVKLKHNIIAYLLNNWYVLSKMSLLRKYPLESQDQHHMGSEFWLFVDKALDLKAFLCV